jgi:hypothetical protein
VRGDSSWNFDRLTVPKNQKQIVSLASHKLFLWSVDAVIRQLEGPVVDRNAGFCAENLVARTASSGAMCTGDINQRGSYAPMANNEAAASQASPESV